ncbi:CLUMA_CG006844, isoform A [Clunio marinus]|uniref:CLUMA_CG006844, isoform A n=1 Tax=Clunio marinus TaxID=568069 RepID=A0A1J1HZ48_9DIPT|nr:CLUMA_CG006844, isoform A [Clunio marinus]
MILLNCLLGLLKNEFQVKDEMKLTHDLLISNSINRRVFGTIENTLRAKTAHHAEQEKLIDTKLNNVERINFKWIPSLILEILLLSPTRAFVIAGAKN